MSRTNSSESRAQKASLLKDISDNHYSHPTGNDGHSPHRSRPDFDDSTSRKKLPLSFKSSVAQNTTNDAQKTFTPSIFAVRMMRECHSSRLFVIPRHRSKSGSFPRQENRSSG